MRARATSAAWAGVRERSSASSSASVLKSTLHAPQEHVWVSSASSASAEPCSISRVSVSVSSERLSSFSNTVPIAVCASRSAFSFSEERMRPARASSAIPATRTAVSTEPGTAPKRLVTWETSSRRASEMSPSSLAFMVKPTERSAAEPLSAAARASWPAVLSSHWPEM